MPRRASSPGASREIEPLPDGSAGREPGGGRRPPDDLVQPFQLETDTGGKPRLMGRLARLGPLVDDVLTRHDYPESVATLLGEALALTATLAAALKFRSEEHTPETQSLMRI